MNWTLHNGGYLCATINKKTVYQHRYVWTQAYGDIPKGMVIHHINSNKTDNRLENLQLTTKTKNNQKMDVIGKGYYYCKRLNKYRADRSINGIKKYLGYFGTPCGAYMANRMFFVRRLYD